MDLVEVNIIYIVNKASNINLKNAVS